MQITGNPYFLFGAAYIMVLFLILRWKESKLLEKATSLLLLLPCVAISVFLCFETKEAFHGIFSWIWAVGATLIWMGIFGLIVSEAIWLLMKGISYIIKPKWMKSDDDSALEALMQETDTLKLRKASTDSNFYRVRAAALEKLGLLQEAKAELAINESGIEKCRENIDGIQVDALLDRIVRESKNPDVKEYALKRINNPDVLKGLQNYYWLNTSLAFEVSRKLSDSAKCCSIISSLLNKGKDNEANRCLQSVEDTALLEAMFLNESSYDVSKLISEQFKGQRILSEQPDGPLAELCCPNGAFHLFRTEEEVSDLGFKDDDDMKAHEYYTRRYHVCQLCGKRY